MGVAYSIEFRALPAVYGEDDRRICVSGVVEMPDATTRDGCCDAYCSFHYSCCCYYYYCSYYYY